LRPRPVTIIAAVVCFAGVVIGVRAFWPEREPPKPVYTPEGLTAYGQMRFGRDDNPARVTDAEIDAFLRDGLSRVEPSAPLTEQEIASLVERARSRLRMVVGPGGPTLEEVRVADGSPPEGNGEEISPRYADWAELWAGAPVALDRSVVRVIPNEDGNYRLGSSARSQVRGVYPKWSRDSEILEVCFAAQPKRSAEKNERTGVYLAFAYTHEPETGRWRFVDCVVYYPGGLVVPPAY
jgi:hypothetical protein